MRSFHLRASALGALIFTTVGIAACSGDAPSNTTPGAGGTSSGGTGGSGGSATGGSATGGEGGDGGAMLACPATQTLCGDVCVSTDTDEDHCGGCDVACDTGESCVSGACELSCPPGQAACGETCVDTDADRQHCGACDTPCDAGEVCDGSGSCALSCQAGLVDCDGTCIDPATSRDHCGAGADCSAEPGATCLAGEVCNGSGICELSCQAGLVDCNGTCIDPGTSRDHCGAAADCTADPGAACLAGEVCDGAGSCELSCQAGLVDCGGTCTQTNTDRNHCGACNDACASGEICNGAGSCELSCQAGFVDCGGVCINADTNILHCGATGSCSGASSGAICSPGEVCAGGTCTQNNIVFVSSQTFGSNFGGIPGADELCQQLADSAGLPGLYYAWLSDDNLSPANRFFQSTQPYVLVDGTVVADNWTDLTDGTLDNAINLTEYGTTPPDSSLGTCTSRHTFWSNTSRAGNSFASNADCTDWTGVQENGSTWGRWDATNFLWSEYCGGGSCTTITASVVCVQQ